MYILTDEPKYSGSLAAGAFDAIDQVYGTEGFTREQAVEAITTVIAVGTEEADQLFSSLVWNEHISEV